MWQLLHSTIFIFYLMPAVVCGNLRCLFRPILENEYRFEPIATECPPDEVCFKAEARYGNYSVLSASGCLPRIVCRKERHLSFKGVVYIMSYACCERPYCNTCVGLVANVFITVTLVTVSMMVGS
ncbi:protein Bouncer [Corythoichthys intestinalis]|uniref:protein Bouncer n=1 Tax=Corythoichthys intestinalis TaxID=161448 RepID=UPI0025A5F9EC|nr:protein Bouncer [Corythoichthys intestinalis]